MPRHFLSLFDLSKDELHRLLERAIWMKAEQKSGRPHQPLLGKTLGMIFEKSSTRTRVSFEVGTFQLGGHALNLTTQASQLGRGETYEDTARVLSRYVDILMMRTFEHERVERLASASSVPVINGLSDLLHPCQLLADLMTVLEEKKQLEKLHIAYVGDGNNMANSWIEAALIFGFKLSIATPKGFEPAATIVGKIKANDSSHITILHDPREAVRGADVINTDTWISMGQEGDDEAAKKKLFIPLQVNQQLIQLAAADAIVLHCLPAHRGEEITDEVMDGPHSRVWDQAENRLHAQKALLEMLCPH